MIFVTNLDIIVIQFCCNPLIAFCARAAALCAGAIRSKIISTVILTAIFPWVPQAVTLRFLQETNFVRYQTVSDRTPEIPAIPSGILPEVPPGIFPRIIPGISAGIFVQGFRQDLLRECLQ